MDRLELHVGQGGAQQHRQGVFPDPMNTGGAVALSPQLTTDIFSLLHSNADVMSKPGPIQLESTVMDVFRQISARLCVHAQHSPGRAGFIVVIHRCMISDALQSDSCATRPSTAAFQSRSWRPGRGNVSPASTRQYLLLNRGVPRGGVLADGRPAGWLAAAGSGSRCCRACGSDRLQRHVCECCSLG